MLNTAKQLLQKAQQTPENGAKVQHLLDAMNALVKVIEQLDQQQQEEASRKVSTPRRQG